MQYGPKNRYMLPASGFIRKHIFYHVGQRRKRFDWRFDWLIVHASTTTKAPVKKWRTQDVDHGSHSKSQQCQEHSTHHASCLNISWLCQSCSTIKQKYSISGFSQLSVQLNLGPNPGEHQLVFADSFPSDMVKHKLWSISIQYIICQNIPITYHSKLPRKMDVHPLKTLNVFELISFRQCFDQQYTNMPNP